MNRRILLAALLGALSLPAGAQDEDPAAVVRAAYALSVRLQRRWSDTTVWFAPHRDRFFSRPLAALLKADEDFMKANPGEQGSLGYDPLLGGQTGTIRDLAIRVGSRDGERAQVRATHRPIRERITIEFDLVREAAGWRINDIRQTVDGEPISLRALLKAGYPTVR